MMMLDGWGQMTPRQGRAFARFLSELRPDWDLGGIDHQLGLARGLGTSPQLAIAAILAACTASNRTPAAIGHQGGRHWQQVAAFMDTSTGTAAQRRREPRCMDCNRTRDECTRIAALADSDGHTFRPLPDPRSLRDHSGRRLNHGTACPPELREQVHAAINNTKEIS